jgi:hypothetical protein
MGQDQRFCKGLIDIYIGILLGRGVLWMEPGLFVHFPLVYDIMIYRLKRL